MQRISIIMRIKNESEGDILETVKRVSEQKYKAFEVILIYSTLEKKTLEILKAYPFLKTICDDKIQPYSSPKTLNYAISFSVENIIVILNGDALPVNSSWLGNLIKPFSDKNVACTYGAQLAWPDAIPTVRKDYFLTFKETKNDKKIDYWFSNVNSALRRSLWEEHSFKENAVIAEDLEFAKWVRKKNHVIVYANEAEVYHSHNYSVSQTYSRFFLEGKSMREIAPRHITFIGFLMRWFKICLEDIIWFAKKGIIKGIWSAPIYRLVEKYGFYRGMKIDK